MILKFFVLIMETYKVVNLILGEVTIPKKLFGVIGVMTGILIHKLEQ
jgi:hypothetical protein